MKNENNYYRIGGNSCFNLLAFLCIQRLIGMWGMKIRDFKYLWNSDEIEFIKSEGNFEVWKVKKTGEKFRVFYKVTREIKEVVKEI